MQKNNISFKGQRIFIGIDVHKDSWRVAVTPEVGTVRSFTQKPSAEALKAHLEKYYPRGEYLAVYETGFSGFSTHYALKAVGVDCIVTHAADVPTTQYEHGWTSSRPSAWVAAGAEGMLGMGMEKPRRGAARFLLGLVALRLSCACH